MNNLMLPLPGLSPASGKTVVVNFDGGLLSSDGDRAPWCRSQTNCTGPWSSQ
jgi:hypothetical protein